MSTLSIHASRKNDIQALLQAHPLFSMYLVMFAVAWSVTIPQALYSQGSLLIALLWIAFTRGRLGFPSDPSRVE